MKAVQLNETGQVEIRDIAVPEPEQDEILIKVAAVGINPVDWKIASGQLDQLINKPLPLTLGWDVAGEVVQAGKGYLAGDKVYGMKTIGQEGALSEYCTVKRSQISLAPKTLDITKAASVPMVSLTSWQALFTAGNIRRHQRVLIQAGAGGVGSIAIQLAKIMGAYVITTTSAKNRDYVLDLGADEVIDYQTSNIIDALKDNPVDLVLECQSGEFQFEAIEVLKPKGKLVSISWIPPEVIKAAEQKGVETEFVFVHYNAEHLRHITDLIDDNQLKITISSQYHFEDIAEAYNESKQGRVRGKLVATF